MSNSRLLRITFFIALFVFVLYCLSPITTPFFLGALLAYLGNPLVTYLHTKRLPRILAVAIVFLFVLVILAAVLILMLPILQEQMSLAMLKIPQILTWLQLKIFYWVDKHEQINTYLNVTNVKRQLAEHSQKISSIASIMIKAITHSTFAMIEFMINLILVPVVAFYLMRDWPKIMKNIQSILPLSIRGHVSAMAKESDEVIGAFFRGQLLVMFGLAIIYSAGLWLIGLQMAIFVGLFCGILAVVPYLGFTVGIIVASLAMYLETHSLIHVTYVWGVYAVGQVSESMVLTPLLVGDKIGLHPVAVIFAVLTGGLLFGFLGVLLALPVAAIILVILKHMIVNETKHAASV